MISAFCINPEYDRQYILKLLIEKLDLEYDTNNEYPYFCELARKDLKQNCRSAINFVQEMPILRKRIELSFGVDIYAKKNEDVLSNNLISEAYLRKVYDFINGDALENISFKEFCRCAAERDFSRIYNSHGVRCSKIKYVIYVISRIAGKEWYIDTAHSINTEPQKCSGASVPKLWRKKLDGIRV